MFDFTQGDDAGREMMEGEEVSGFFLEAFLEFFEPVEPGMGDFDNPSSGFVCGIFVFLFDFFAARPDVGNVTVIDHVLPVFFPDVSGIGAQIFSALPFWRGINNPSIQNVGQLGDVMPVGAAYDDRQRDATLFDQKVSL